MQLTVIPVAVDVLGTISKSLEEGTGGNWNSWKLSRASCIAEIGQKTRSPEETFCHSDCCERPPANDGMKNSQGIIIRKENLQNCGLCCSGWPQN